MKTTRERLPARPAPLEQAVMWKPLDDAYHLLASMLGRVADDYALFVTQRLLLALEDETAAQNGQGTFGVLVGRRYQCPETRLRYCVLHTLRRMPSLITADVLRPDTRHVQRALGEIRVEAPDEVLGWFARASSVSARLPQVEEQLHAKHFPHPWQAGLMLAPSFLATAGGFYFYTAKGERSFQVPFYELNTAPSAKGHRKASVVEWYNYTTDDEIAQMTPAQRDALRAASFDAEWREPGTFDAVLGQLKSWIIGSREQR